MVRRVFNDFGWKAFSLAMAFVLWLIFSGTQELSTVVSAPVQYRNIARTLDISSEMVETVELHLRGPGTQLSRLREASLPVILDLSQVKAPGEKTFTIEPATLRLPSGVNLERAVPSQIRLRLEHRASREVPVRVRHGAPPKGWQVVGIDCEPSQVNILGPESRVETLQFVETDPVSLTQAPALEARVAVFTGDPQVSFAGPQSVLVKIRLQHDK